MAARHAGIFKLDTNCPLNAPPPTGWLGGKFLQKEGVPFPVVIEQNRQGLTRRGLKHVRHVLGLPSPSRGLDGVDRRAKRARDAASSVAGCS